MLINARLPIDSDRLREQDQTFSLAGMNWDDYQAFNEEEYSSYKVSYYKGVITLVSPSKNHERIAETIGILVIAYCEKFNLPYFPMGSTRLQNKPNAGKEAALSYTFNTDKDIPDLAIEVVFSSGSLEDLKKYRAIGVKEVWFWQDNKITFYQLDNKGYREILLSVNLPNLASDTLTQFTNRGFNESPLIIKQDFLKQL